MDVRMGQKQTLWFFDEGCVLLTWRSYAMRVHADMDVRAPSIDTPRSQGYGIAINLCQFG
jgi:hypothetical protein